MAITTQNKKFATSIVAIALNMSEVSIKEKFNNAKELTFAEIISLAADAKIKRYDDEVKELTDKLTAYNKLFA